MSPSARPVPPGGAVKQVAVTGGDERDFQIAKDRVLAPRLGDMYLAQPELVAAGSLHNTAQGLGQQLRAETDGKDGDTSAVDLRKKALLGTQGLGKGRWPTLGHPATPADQGLGETAEEAGHPLRPPPCSPSPLKLKPASRRTAPKLLPSVSIGECCITKARFNVQPAR